MRQHTGKDTNRAVIHLYTDGGCKANPGKGAWAAVIYEDSPKPREIMGAETYTTNNRMELRAAIEGLKAIEAASRMVRVYSDSAYLVDAFNQGWLSKWSSNGWRTARKKPVENADLWRELLDLTSRRRVQFVKVKGHDGIPGNERCHVLVQRAMSNHRSDVKGGASMDNGFTFQTSPEISRRIAGAELAEMPSANRPCS